MVNLSFFDKSILRGWILTFIQFHNLFEEGHPTKEKFLWGETFAG